MYKTLFSLILAKDGHHFWRCDWSFLIPTNVFFLYVSCGFFFLGNLKRLAFFLNCGILAKDFHKIPSNNFESEMKTACSTQVLLFLGGRWPSQIIFFYGAELG